MTYKKNVLLKDALREETREATLGLGVTMFFASLIGCTMVYWSVYGDDLGLQEAVINAFKTVLTWLFAGTAAVFGATHALERGKKARYYYRRLASCPADARGRR